MRVLIGTICLAAITAGPVLAKPPLRDIAEIDDAVMAVAIADEIRKSCKNINARLIRAYTELSALKALARERGYSDEEVEAYVTSKSEKARMRQKAERYLQAKGVAPEDTGALCAFGKAEIAAETAIGRLLK
ncbi:DUF5333 domain-containing protein [Marivita sp. GX14005]|uniref:DUF5333 domain-containing protein n=1 Tax=Marivita sp. GX14005 TaxID=2942276 RepID=UPI00201888AE|nr:DUF5333 domain-containing protein [Marivita sp. GX14005]MCL3882758.1 DUF5333 domain-containing protein [Marivita sp. GX14005]